jgi:hypothetical protein
MSYIYGPSKTPPRGWLTTPSGVLLKDESIDGYLARGRTLRGVCTVRDCRRRCELDFERLSQRGLGRLSADDLKRLYRCHRLDGCALDFHEQDGVELTLSMLSGRDYVHIRIACGGCRKASIVRPEAVIAKLTAEKTGGPDTPVANLAALSAARAPSARSDAGPPRSCGTTRSASQPGLRTSRRRAEAARRLSEQAAWMYVQRRGDADKHEQRWIAAPALDASQVGEVDLGLEGELLLSNATG